MSASMYPTYEIGTAPKAVEGKKIFDCSICDEIPGREIEASSEEEAKALYLAIVLKAITVEQVTAIEVEIVG